MLITLAVVGGLAILSWFIRAIGLKRINIEFDGRRRTLRRIGKGSEKPRKELSH